MHFVPPELCDRTIDYLWDDPRALRACSLTCRAWLPSTRLHLFHSISLNGPNDCARLIAVLDVSAKASAGLEFYIRELTLSGRFDRHWNVWSNPKAMDIPLSQLLVRLDRVECLKITATRHVQNSGPDAADTADPYREMLRCLCQGPFARSIRSLHLTHIAFPDSADIECLLASYPRLTHLKLSHVYANRCSPSLQKPAHHVRKAALEDLVFVNTDSPLTMADWLFETSFGRLRTLDWQGRVTKDGQPVLKDLLRAAGPSLEHARLYLRLQREQVAQDWLVDLSPCTRLVSLDLSCDRWLPSVLAQLRSPQLALITIKVHLFRGYEAQMDWSAWDWSAIDTHLARLGRTNSQLAAVLQFHRRAVSDDWLAEKVAFVSPRLPAARNAGVRIAVSAIQALDQMPYAEWWLA
ncbi:hypothetical protein B0H21DRAFT_753234 [Amylocystis lapponica]|nr:hypothetical protein B0H21DRAFT_753234 [Amylocystis lapponica]